MYCAENYISCSIIYILNISGLIIVLGILIKNKDYYSREWKRIRQVIKDYTIDYKSEGNMVIFAKFMSVLIGFFALIVTSIVSIILWDTSFGFMEIANILLWIICGFLFYIDYRSIFKFSKHLRIALGIILTIQLASGIVFAFERNQENETPGLDDLKVEAFVYLTNFIIMLLINIISIFFPKFDYQKVSKNTDDNDFISFHTLNKSLVQDDSLQSQPNQQNTQQSQRQSISKAPKRSQSFLDQLDALSSDGQDSQQNSIGSSSIQKLKQEQQSGLIDPMYGLKREEEAIQKEKEQQELMNQIMETHKQLDEKLNKLKPKDEPSAKPQSTQKQADQQSINELSTIQIQNDSQMKISKYEIQNIKIDGFQEIKKQGKRFIYFTIIYFSNTKQRLVKTEHNLKEFHQLRLSLQQTYVDHTFPEIPERKPNERLNGKEVAARGQALEKLLQFIVKNQMWSPQLEKFLKEVKGTIQVEDEKEPADIDQVLKDKVFDDFLEMRKQSITQKQSFLDREFNDDSFDPKSSIAGSNFDPNQYFQRNYERSQTNGPTVYKFQIKDIQKQPEATFYKIEAVVNGVVTSTVLRRYNDFIDINKKLLAKLIKIPSLPNEPPNKSDDLIAYRKEALAIFINQLYANQDVKSNMLFKEFVGI